jgi:hypothetical protein
VSKLPDVTPHRCSFVSRWTLSRPCMSNLTVWPFASRLAHLFMRLLR